MTIHRRFIEDLTGEEAWSVFGTFLNADELLDELALATRQSPHAAKAYELLRQVSSTAIQPATARLFVIDARNGR